VLHGVVSNRWFFGVDTCVSTTQLNSYLEENEPFSSLKILICGKYSFQKLTQFSQGYNVPDVPACNTDGFL
jgi:hypothetical protein